MRELSPSPLPQHFSMWGHVTLVQERTFDSYRAAHPGGHVALVQSVWGDTVHGGGGGGGTGGQAALRQLV